MLNLCLLEACFCTFSWPHHVTALQLPEYIPNLFAKRLLKRTVFGVLTPRFSLFFLSNPFYLSCSERVTGYDFVHQTDFFVSVLVPWKSLVRTSIDSLLKHKTYSRYKILSAVLLVCYVTEQLLQCLITLNFDKINGLIGKDF